MRVLLTSQGSTGDIVPMIAFGRALREAGHAVSFATAPLYRNPIESAGLTYICTPPDWSLEVFADLMRQSSRSPHPLMVLRRFYRAGLPFLHELLDVLDQALAGHDVLVSSYVFPYFKVLADRQKKPFALFGFCHNTVPTPLHPPELVPGLRWLGPGVAQAWNRLMWRISDGVLDWNVNDIIGRTLEDQGLPRMRNFLMRPAECCLVAVSEALMKPPAGVPARFHFTGYLRWQAPDDPDHERELEAFCAGEQVPVLNFGSVTFDHVSEVMSRFEQHWPRGRKIIIQSGWAGLSVELDRPEIKVMGAASHDQLFRFASVVIHHGGAGTTASVLHAGRPHLIVPHIADQPFWASEVERLGVGRRLDRRHWPEQLPAAVAALAADPAVAPRAQALAQQLATENGRARAVAVLADYVAHGAAPTGLWS